MDLSSLHSLTATNQWGALLPEISLGIVAVFLLLLELLMPQRKVLIFRLAITAQVIVLGQLVFLTYARLDSGTELFFGDSIQQSFASDLARLFLLASSILVSHLALVMFRSRNELRVEFIHILMVVTAAFMVLVQSHNFALLFVALETVAVGFYVLIAFTRSSAASLEAGLKYLIISAFSSALLMFGIVLLFGAAGNPLLAATASNPFDFAQINAFISAGDWMQNNVNHPMVLIGAVLVLAGVAFKMGAFPFQFWIPDVYQGAPTPVTAFLGTCSKGAGFFLLYLLLSGPFAPLKDFLLPLLSVVAIMTIAFGNIAALTQRNAKRVMGLSGVSHAGFLMMGFLAVLHGATWVLPVLFFYMCVYTVASFTVFEVMCHMQTASDDDQEIDYFNNLMQRNPFLGSSLVVGLGSLAGIPPLAGFIAKLLLFIAAVQTGLYLVLGVAVVGVVLSIYYYFGWMRTVVFTQPALDNEQPIGILSPSFGSKFILSLLMAASLLIGLFPAFW